MKLKELNIQAFEEYLENNFLDNYMQTLEYAELMREYNYKFEFIGLVDENDVIMAASLILIKKIGFNFHYGYAPKGFLINYYDENLVKTFIDLLKVRYSKKNITFIKINPEIVVSTIDTFDFKSHVNPNMKLKQDLEKLGFVKLKDNFYFESLEPRYNAYVNLKNSNFSDYSKTNRNKVRNAKRKGLYYEIGNEHDIDDIYPLLNDNKKINYFKNLYHSFNNKIDIILVKVDFEKFIKNSQELYEKELDKNNLYNEILHRSNKKNDLNRKMNSDSRLCTIKNEIVLATENLRKANNIIVAAAFVIKYKNRVHIVASGYDKKMYNLNANYFLFDSIINNYKHDYEYLDLNGITGDFKDSNPYKGLNRFKLGFNPNIYEYIGEFDLVFNKINYEYLLTTGKLAKEFNKKNA